MTTPTPYVDPFDTPEKHPSLSWKNVPFGTTVHTTIVSLPKKVQGRDYDTGEPAVWDNGDPKMVIVMEVDVVGQGVRSIWSNKGTAMYAALQDAQKAAGARFEIGGRLSITITHEVQNPQKPKLNPAKQFKAVYAPHDPFSDAPEFAFGDPDVVPMPDARKPNGQVMGAHTGPPAQASPQPAASQSPMLDPAVMAALANLNPEMLAEMAKQAAQR